MPSTLLFIEDEGATGSLQQLVFQVPMPKVLLAKGVTGVKTGPVLLAGAALDSPALCFTYTGHL